MLALAIVVFLVSAILLAIFIHPSKIIYIKALILPLICVGFVICLVIMSKTAVDAVISGLKLWSGAVIPALFPFFVSAEIMNSTGLTNAAGVLLEPVMRPIFNVPGCGSFPFLMGIISGYPVGAKITCDSRKAGNLTKIEAERLLAYTSNSGPLFIIGGVGTGMLLSPSLGIYLYICHFLSSLTVGLIFRFYKRKGKNKYKMNVPLNPSSNRSDYRSFLKNRPPNLKNRPSSFKNCPSNLKNCPPGSSPGPIGTVLGDAVRNAISSVLTIGGFIVLFSVIISILNQLGVIGAMADILHRVLKPLGVNYEVLKGVFSGIIEISTGSRLISQVPNVSDLQKLTALSCVIGWAGFCVHFQVLSFVASTDLSIKPYFIGKLLHSAIALVYTWIGLKILPPEYLIKEPVLSSPSSLAENWLHTFSTATKTACVLLAVFAIFRLTAGLKKSKAVSKNIPSI